MSLKLAIILTAASIVLGSKAKHKTKVAKQDVNKQGPQEGPQVTWEDCVEFHFDGCKPSGFTTSKWSNYIAEDEALCISRCNNCEQCPDQVECEAIINNVKDYMDPNPELNCWKTEIRDGRVLTDNVCTERWGHVIKGVPNRYALKQCITAEDVRCMRGKCDMDGHLDAIPMSNALYLKTEAQCMDYCWGHSNPNEGSCTHYKFVPSPDAGANGRCYYYKRKNTTTATDTNYKCGLYSLSNSPESTAFGIPEIAACKSGGKKIL